METFEREGTCHVHCHRLGLRLRPRPPVFLARASARFSQSIAAMSIEAATSWITFVTFLKMTDVDAFHIRTSTGGTK